MIAADYQAKRAQGLCVYSSRCRQKAWKGMCFCKKHRAIRRRDFNGTMKRAYWRKKLAGVCVTRGCNLPQMADCVRCEKHRAYENAMRRAEPAEKKARRSRGCKETRLRWKHRGLCMGCGAEPLVTATLGAACRSARLERDRLRRRARGQKPLTCGMCGGEGHNQVGCDKRFSNELNVEDYLFTGQTNLAEAQR